MTKGSKVFFGVILCIAILCFALGIAVRSSYTGYRTFEEMELAEDLEGYSVQLQDARENGLSDCIKVYSDLVRKADLIAKVYATKERKLSIHAVTKTKVIVKKIYRGSQKEGQDIYIYEPAGFSYAISKSYDTAGGYQLMKEGEEYYVFLKKLKAAKGYQMSEQEKNTFLPSTVLYSKFPVQQGNVVAVDAKRLEEGEYHYGEIKDLEIITSDQGVLTNYKQIKKQVICDNS